MFNHQHLHRTNTSTRMFEHKNGETSRHHNFTTTTTSTNPNASAAMQNNCTNPMNRCVSSEYHTTYVTKVAPKRCNSWQKSVLEDYYKQRRFIDLKVAHQLSIQLNMTQERVKGWFRRRRKSEKSKNVRSTSSTKLFRPFLPSPVKESSNPSSTSPVSLQSTGSSYVTNDWPTRSNTIGSRSSCSVVPKKRWSTAFFRPFIDNNQLSPSQSMCSVITPNSNFKPEITSNGTPQMSNRRIQFDRVKTGQELMKPCGFSVAEFEQYLQQNIKSKQQKPSPDNQLAYISVSYNNNHLMSIPIKPLSGYQH